MPLHKRKLTKFPADKFAEARIERQAVKGQANFEKQTRIMWEAARDALLLASKDDPLDKEIAAWLANNIDEILANNTPNEIKALLKPGGIKNTATIQDAQLSIALYWQAVKAGAIDDKTPIATINKHCSCSKQTIYDWIKKAPKNLWEKYLPNEDLSLRVKRVKIRMQKDGKFLDFHSQTQKGIISRRK